MVEKVNSQIALKITRLFLYLKCTGLLRDLTMGKSIRFQYIFVPNYLVNDTLIRAIPFKLHASEIGEG